MTHETITYRVVNQFAWYDSRKEALSKAAKLKRQGKSVYIGGKRAKNKRNYIDIVIAAIIHDDKGDGSKPWVIAWHD